MNKIHEWINTGLIVLVAILVLVGGNQSDQFGAQGTRLPHGVSADTTSPITGEVRGTTLKSTATTTIGHSPDGFVLWDDFTVSTTTPVRAALTNNGAPLMCEGDTLTVYTDGTAFAPPFYFVLGTTTSATSYSANLVGSTTVATSTDNIDSVQSPSTTWPFLLANGSSITLSVGDAVSNASTTYLTNWAGQVSVHCWTIGE